MKDTLKSARGYMAEKDQFLKLLVGKKGDFRTCKAKFFRIFDWYALSGLSFSGIPKYVPEISQNKAHL